MFLKKPNRNPIVQETPSSGKGKYGQNENLNKIPKIKSINLTKKLPPKFEQEQSIKKINKFEKLKQDRENKKIEEKIEVYERDFFFEDDLLAIDENKLNPFLEKVFKLDMISKCLKLHESKVSNTCEKYSKQEIDALLSNENFILLGRSGTGKTMVVLTKIFLLKMCANLKECKLLCPELNSTSTIRVIFCTTSSKLIDEAFNYYSMNEKKFMDIMKKDYNPISKFSLHAFDLIQVGF